MERTTLYVSIIFVLCPSLCLGAFSFDDKKEEIFCENCMKLRFNYVTDETVTVIEWYKQRGVLIARIFGVNLGNPFTVLPPYDAAPYTVTEDIPCDDSIYNASIQIKNVTASDEGPYSVNVTAASPQSAVLTMKLVSALTAEDKPTVDCNTMTCTPPDAAVGVTTKWTTIGKTHRCTLKGGNAECCDSCDMIYAECTIMPTTEPPTTPVSASCPCLLALLLILLPPIVQLLALLIIMCKEGIWGPFLWAYHIGLTVPLFGFVTLIPVQDDTKEKCLFKKETCNCTKGEKIWINFFTIIAPVLVIILNFIVCENGLGGLCFLPSGVCYLIVIVIIVRRHYLGFKDTAEKDQKNAKESVPLKEKGGE